MYASKLCINTFNNIMGGVGVRIKEKMLSDYERGRGMDASELCRGDLWYKEAWDCSSSQGKKCHICYSA